MEKESIFKRRPKLMTVIIVVILILIIDFIAALIFISDKTDYSIARVKNNMYHHGLLPSTRTPHNWGGMLYTLTTNSLGFKDKEKRNIELQTEQPRLLVIGDSFVEGEGYIFEDTFVGKLKKRMEPFGWDVLNAGVDSYSPKLIYLKLKYLLERKKLDFDQLIVFIDISDMINELEYDSYSSDIDTNEELKIDYRRWFQKRYKHYFRKYSFFYSKYRLLRNQVRKSLETLSDENSRVMYAWTYDNAQFSSWGEEGFLLAKNYMEKIVELTKEHNISLAIAVYPWPNQLEHDDVEKSRQVTLWKDFSKSNNISFINLFPPFFDKGTSQEVINSYFIPGDCHWNDQGHELVSDYIWKNYLKDKVVK